MVWDEHIGGSSVGSESQPIAHGKVGGDDLDGLRDWIKAVDLVWKERGGPEPEDIAVSIDGEDGLLYSGTDTHVTSVKKMFPLA